MGVRPVEVNLRQLDVLAAADEEVGGSARGGDAKENTSAADGNVAAGRSRETLEQAVKLVAESVANTRVAFQVDTETGDVTIKVIDNVTGEVVRSVPPQELAAMMRRLEEFAGLVVDKRR